MNRVAGPHEEGPPNIIEARLLQGQISDFESAEGTKLYLEFWLKDALLLNSAHERQSDEDFVVNPTAVVALDSPEQAQDILAALDAGMVYVYSQLGVDNARLVSTEGCLALADLADELYSAEEALSVVAMVHEIKSLMERDEWNQDALFLTMGFFHKAMGWGDSHVKGDTLILSGLVDDFSDGIETAYQDEPVTITYHEGDTHFAIEYTDTQGQIEQTSMVLMSDTVLLAMMHLNMIGMNRNVSNDGEYKLFEDIYNTMGRRDIDAVIHELVPEFINDPRLAAAQAAFFDMMPDGPGELN